jgi:hypothetical protein
MKTSTSHSLCDNDDDDAVDNDDDNLSENEILHIDARKNENYLIDGDIRCRRRITQAFDYDNDCDSLSDHDSYSEDDDDDDDKQIGDGLNELDTFFVRKKEAAVKTVTAIV